MVIKLGHLVERLEHVGEVLDLYGTIHVWMSFNLHRDSNDDRDVE